jgi:hypothetical protein
MKRTPLNRVSKQKCRKANRDCQGLCSKCDSPHVIVLTKKKHTELSRAFLKRPRKPINPISKKKAQEIQDEKPIREALKKRANGRCEWCGRAEWECYGGLHPHEKIFRSKGKAGRMSLENSVYVCNTCQGIRGHHLSIIEKGHKFLTEH